MKNLLLTTAFLLGLSVAAKTTISTNVAILSVYQEKEYKKVENTQVPADILKQVNTRYSGYALLETYIAADSEYKLVLNKDGKTVTAYYKSTGEFIKEEAK